MIEFIDVGKYYVTEFGKHWIFRDVNLTLGFDKSVAVIGPNGAGKSTFLRLVAGADIPSEGQILRSGRISPPMGLTPSIQMALSAAENARFAGRIYGLGRDEIEDLIETVRETADIGQFFDLPVASYSAGMRQRVSFAINISMRFEYYIFDEITAAGDREFRKFSTAKVRERLDTAKFVIASHRTDELIDLCDAAILIANGELQYFDDVEEALSIYKVDDADEEERARSTAKARKRERAPKKEAGEDDDQADQPASRAERVRRIRELKTLLRAEARDRDAAPAESEAGEGAAPTAAPELTEEDAKDVVRRQRLGDIRDRLAALKESEALTEAQAAELQALRDEMESLRAERRAYLDAKRGGPVAEPIAQPQNAADGEAVSTGGEATPDDAPSERSGADAEHVAAETKTEQPEDADSPRRQTRRRIREIRTRMGELRQGGPATPDMRRELQSLKAELVQLLEQHPAGEERAAESAAVPDVTEAPAVDADETTGETLRGEPVAQAASPDEQAGESPAADRRAKRLEGRKARQAQKRANRQRLAAEADAAATPPDAPSPPAGTDAPSPASGGDVAMPALPMARVERQGERGMPSSHRDSARSVIARAPAERPVLSLSTARPSSPPAAAANANPDLRHTLLRQERAQAKSARAMRLLFQHLETSASSNEPAASHGRTALIAAAQESAAVEAAEARTSLEEAVAAQSPALPPPSYALAVPPAPLRRAPRRDHRDT